MVKKDEKNPLLMELTNSDYIPEIGLTTTGLAGGIGTGLALSAEDITKSKHGELSDPLSPLRAAGPRRPDQADLLLSYIYKPGTGSGEAATANRFAKGIKDRMGDEINVYTTNMLDDKKNKPVPLKDPEVDFVPFDKIDEAKRKSLIGVGDFEYRLDKLNNAPMYTKLHGTEDAVDILHEAGFAMNYSPDMGRDRMLPFTEVAGDLDPDRGNILDIAKRNKIDLPSDIADKKIIVVAGGGVGKGIPENIKALKPIADARDDVYFIFLQGKGGYYTASPNFGREWADIANRAYDGGPKDNWRLAKKYLGDKATVVGEMPSQDFRGLQANADLLLGYAGSSSATEQIQYRNPNVFTLTESDALIDVNTKNAQWASNNWGTPIVDTRDPRKYAESVNNLLDNSEEAAKIAYNRGREAQKMATQRSDEVLDVIRKAKKGFPLDIAAIKDRSVAKWALLGAAVVGTGTAGYAIYNKIKDKYRNAYKKEGRGGVSSVSDFMLDMGAGALMGAGGFTLGRAGLYGAGKALLKNRDVTPLEAMYLLQNAPEKRVNELKEYFKNYKGKEHYADMLDDTKKFSPSAIKKLFKDTDPATLESMKAILRDVHKRPNKLKDIKMFLDNIPTKGLKRNAAVGLGLTGAGALASYLLNKQSSEKKEGIRKINKKVDLGKTEKDSSLGAAAKIGGAGILGALSLISLGKVPALKKISGKAGDILKTYKKADNIKLLDDYSGLVEEFGKTHFPIMGVSLTDILKKTTPSVSFNPYISTLDNIGSWFDIGQGATKRKIARGKFHYSDIDTDFRKTLLKEVLNADSTAAPVTRGGMKPELRDALSAEDVAEILQRKGSIPERIKGYEEVLQPFLNQRRNDLFGWDPNQKPIVSAYKNAVVDPVLYGGTPLFALGGVGGLGYAGWKAKKQYLDKEGSLLEPFKQGQKTSFDKMIEDATGQDVKGTRRKGNISALLATLIGSGGMAAGAGGLLHSAKKNKAPKGKETIVVSSGALDKPVFNVDTGAGHKTPAKAAIEGLMAHKDADQFDIRNVLVRNNPDNTGVELVEEILDEAGKGTGKYKPALKGVDVMNTHMDTGFGLGGSVDYLTPKQRRAMPAIARQLDFIPDAVPRGLTGMALLQGQRNPASLRERVTFGPDDYFLSPLHKRFANFGDMHPALTNDAIGAAQQYVKEDMSKPAILENTKNLVDKEGKNILPERDQMKINAFLERVPDDNIKMITISGSSRGDAVAINALDIAKRLQKEGKDNVIIMAQMGKGANSASAKLIDGIPNIINVPFVWKPTNPGLLENMQGIADVHLASTGASAQAEALMSKGNNVFMNHFEPRKEREIAMLRQMEANGLITTEELNKRVDGFKKVNLDSWNKGGQEWMQRLQAKGTPGVRIADDVVSAVMEELDTPSSSLEARRARAAEFIKSAKQNKASLADEIIAGAKSIKANRKKILRNKYIGAGALGLGALGLPVLLYQYMKSKNKNKKNGSKNKMDKKSAEDLGMNPLQAILQQGAPAMPDRPGNPVLDGAAVADNGVVDDAPSETRKLSISDKSMDGDEIKMTVESSKEDDDRINFLLGAFTDKTDEGASEGGAPIEEGALPEPAEEMVPQVPPAQAMTPII